MADFVFTKDNIELINNIESHDAELKTIQIKYEEYSILVNLILNRAGKAPEKCLLKFILARDFNITMKEPWGSGMYIYQLSVTIDSVDKNKLKCNMLLNSGDNLNIQAKQIEYTINGTL